MNSPTKSSRKWVENMRATDEHEERHEREDRERMLIKCPQFLAGASFPAGGEKYFSIKQNIPIGKSRTARRVLLKSKIVTHNLLSTIFMFRKANDVDLLHFTAIHGRRFLLDLQEHIK